MASDFPIEKKFSNHAPDALIVNVTPAQLPWDRLQAMCHNHKPHPIPVLYESCVFDTPLEAGINDLNGHSAFITKPIHTDDLRSHIYRLLELAQSGQLEPGTREADTFH